MGQKVTKEVAKKSAESIKHSAESITHQPDKYTGFSRGAKMLDIEKEQKEFLEKRMGKSPKEMPVDLLKFMKEMGPVQVDKMPEIVTKRKPTGAEGRRTQPMRLAKNVKGFETMRTTNFVGSPEEVEPPGKRGLDLIDCYKFLTKQSKGFETPSDRQKQWMSAAQKYIEVPVIFKDEDNSLIAASESKKDELLFLHRNLVVYPPDQVRLVLKDIHDAQVQEALEQQRQGEKAAEKRQRRSSSSLEQ